MNFVNNYDMIGENGRLVGDWLQELSSSSFDGLVQNAGSGDGDFLLAGRVPNVGPEDHVVQRSYVLSNRYSIDNCYLRAYDCAVRVPNAETVNHISTLADTCRCFVYNYSFVSFID